MPQLDLERWLLAIFEVAGGVFSGQYFVPLAIAFEDSEEARWRKLQPAALARVRQQAAVGVLADAGADEDFCRSLVAGIAASQLWATRQGQVRCHPTGTLAPLRGAQAPDPVAAPAGAPGGNTTVRA